MDRETRDPAMLPFDLPRLTRGYAELTAGAAAAGAAAAAAVSAALEKRLGMPVSVSGRPLPGADAGPAGARLALDLSALPGQAILEVDASLVARLVDRLAGGPGEAPVAAAPTPIESSVLELLALLALDAAAADEAVARVLSPRLARGGAVPESPLAVALELDLGGLRGRGRLLLPHAAVRALAGPPAVPETLATLAVPASLRSGSSAVAAEELALLSPGDALLLDAAPSERGHLVLPGGFRLSGPLDEEGFHVEEMAMTEHAAAAPVTIEVELARVTLTLGQLARLAPGAALPLHLDRRGLVTLRAGERCLARGELVDVEGAVGVRITAVGEGP
ncbi:MAG TPA: FliM/FliN family flagellar motor switch protein [Anaeromyxobacteraceae bacterium]|nr:FliM/FliN family flagellar motor switch protein [Anaeromyxobacteraceae bacterium]